MRGLIGSATDDGYTYKLDPRCKAGDRRVNCQVLATCTTADGAEGTIYIIWRYTTTPAPGPGSAPRASRRRSSPGSG